MQDWAAALTALMDASPATACVFIHDLAAKVGGIEFWILPQVCCAPPQLQSAELEHDTCPAVVVSCTMRRQPDVGAGLQATVPLCECFAGPETLAFFSCSYEAQPCVSP